MNCIIVDDEPLAREAVEMLVNSNEQLTLLGAFGSAQQAAAFVDANSVDLVFLDIHMAGMNGIDFARTIHRKSLIIFITAFSQYALDSYEVEAIDYLVKPLQADRFEKAVRKALSYHQLLLKVRSSAESDITFIEDGYFFVKSNRKIIKVHFKDVLFIEGLKDYVVIHTTGQKIITAINIKTILDQLSKQHFFRISKSYIINLQHITSFDNNVVYIGRNEIPIGSAFRNAFFTEQVNKRLLRR
jgi:DNA-binding LytR/AlgR family response regulator